MLGDGSVTGPLRSYFVKSFGVVSDGLSVLINLQMMCVRMNSVPVIGRILILKLVSFWLTQWYVLSGTS